jgi:CelD/BcsL family acetyltransferase involved in cellulose biosynthesis
MHQQAHVAVSSSLQRDGAADAQVLARIEVVRDLATLRGLEADWERLRKPEQRYFPDFDDACEALQGQGTEFCLFAVRRAGAVETLALFVCAQARKPFKIGERLLFTMRVCEVSLLGSSVLGRIDAKLLGEMLAIVARTFSPDLVRLGEISLDSDLHVALAGGVAGFIASSPDRKPPIRWLIRLPESFESYLSGLSAKRRQTVKRNIRKLESEPGFSFEVINEAHQIERFLAVGESISRRTYQWHVGDRLCDDEATRAHYRRLAARGQMRCYLMHLHGRPCAFLRGQLSGGVYHYETPGYDPSFAKLSPGLVLLLLAINDLIENTLCTTFDFGTGGDAAGYKSKFGNASFVCANLELVPWRNPYGVLLVAAQRLLTTAKNALSALVGDGELRRRLKKAIRQQSD